MALHLSLPFRALNGLCQQPEQFRRDTLCEEKFALSAQGPNLQGNSNTFDGSEGLGCSLSLFPNDPYSLCQTSETSSSDSLQNGRSRRTFSPTEAFTSESLAALSETAQRRSTCQATSSRYPKERGYVLTRMIKQVSPRHPPLRMET